MIDVKKLAMAIAGTTLCSFCLGIKVAQAHPGHPPFVRHESSSPLTAGGQDVLIVPPDASGRPVYSVFTGFSTFLAVGAETGGQFSLFDLTVTAQNGPPPHRHFEQDEAFYVLDGELRFLLGNEAIVATPGTFAYIPRGRRHQFFNPTTTPARLLALTIPSGFEGFFAEEGRLVTDPSNPPPPRTDFTEIAPIAARYDTALALAPEPSDIPQGLRDFILAPPGAPNRPSFSEAGGLFTSLASSEETDGLFSLFDVLLTPQAEPKQLQRSDRQSQSFYILDGEVTFQIGNQTTVGTPGTFVYLPQGTSYSYQNLGTTPARTLLLSTPVSVPEPTSVLGLLGLAALGTVSLLKRRQKQENQASQEHLFS
jgi:quercetin dioxygenase-like cupin family protein